MGEGTAPREASSSAVTALLAEAWKQRDSTGCAASYKLCYSRLLGIATPELLTYDFAMLVSPCRSLLRGTLLQHSAASTRGTVRHSTA
jgi:hypothetical protein